MPVSTYRIGTARQPSEGLRIGTVRFLPRGVRREDYARHDYFDVWFPPVAPSAQLLRWYRTHKQPSQAVWQAFARRYRREMQKPAARACLALLAEIGKRTRIAIGCYCADEQHCHRSVLRELIVDAGKRR
jgi:uncharacterized protein YeaO (DUF488 family)